ncbi:MAG TPA: aminoglycoside phosphotransferase family protein [Micrococcaceae bacterium]
MATHVPIPADLARRYQNSAPRRAWLAALPDTVAAVLESWSLEQDLAPGQEPWNGFGAIVVPVRAATGERCVVKVSFPYEEAFREPTALALWDGNGAVRMLAADSRCCAVLLERLDGHHSLGQVPMEDAVAVWGTVVRSLAIVPDGRPGWDLLPHIAATAERWSDELPEQWEQRGRPFPRWLLEAALEVCQTRGTVGRRSGRDVLVHTDLHYLNILARRDGSGFAAIDPQPQIGEAEFAVAPTLWNRIRDLSRADPRRGLRERCAALCEAAGLDYEIARQWSLVREVENALTYASKHGHEGDAARSLWVASTMAGKVLAGLPAAHELKIL